MSEEQEIQRVLSEQQQLSKAIEEVSRQIGTLERIIYDRRMALETIEEDIKRPLEEKDLLVPIGGEVYAFSSLSAVDKVVVSVGADVYVAKKKQDAKELLEERLEDVQKTYEERVEFLQELRRRHDQLRSSLMQHQLQQQGQQPNA